MLAAKESMWKENNSGPRTEPCGRPHRLTGNVKDELSR